MNTKFSTLGRRQAVGSLLVLSCIWILLAACSAPQPLPAIDAIAFTSNRSGNADIYLVNVDGTQLIQLTNDPAADYRPAWSPDGQRIAFISERDGDAEIYTMNADGSNQTRLTFDPGTDWAPAWSPNGEQIAFTSDREGNFNIYLMHVEGSNTTRYTTGPNSHFWPAWSPDGQHLAYHSATSLEAFLCVLEVGPLPEETALTSPTCSGNGLTRDSNPAWSPNGERIAFQRAFESATNIYLTDANLTEAATQLTQSGTVDWFPSWSPDGKNLAYTASIRGNLEIYIIAADGADPRALASDPATDSYPAWRPRDDR